MATSGMDLQGDFAESGHERFQGFSLFLSEVDQCNRRHLMGLTGRELSYKLSF